MFKEKSVLVTGARGFLGKHICDLLATKGATVLKADRSVVELRNQQETQIFFDKTRPQIVVHCAVQGGGIGWMKENPVASGQDNLRMNINVLEASHSVGVEKFIGVSSACIYPKSGAQPYEEKTIWDGYPEPLNGPYALSKRMMMDLGRAYHQQYGFPCVFPILANLYGPHDHLNPSRAHVITDLMLRCLQGPKELTVWGTGEAEREFLYVEDAAEGVLECFKAPSGTFVNIGSGESTSILTVAQMIVEALGMEVPICLDPDKPNGQLRKVLCVEKAKKVLQWEAKTPLDIGLQKTAEWYRQQLY